jgi:hypothetical protein
VKSGKPKGLWAEKYIEDGVERANSCERQRRISTWLVETLETCTSVTS